MSIIKLPSKLQTIFNKDKELANVVLNNLSPFADILEEKSLFFFPDYTDHSITHNEEVLKSIQHLIAKDTLKTLSPTDIGVLVTAVALHDIGMHTSPELFKNLIDGKYDDIPDSWFENEKSWKELWLDYLKESHYWDEKKWEDVIGKLEVTDKEEVKNKKKYTIDEKKLTQKIHDSLSLDGRDQRFIGEFIRKHHPRLAYEIALKGYIVNEPINFKEQDLPDDFMQLSGLVARSHGVNLRDAIEILKINQSEDIWKTPSNVKVVFLMALIRIADYLQLDASRTNRVKLNLRTIYSPYSLKEHERHLAIKHIQFGNDDPERIVVQAKPKDALIYVEIEKIVKNIQKEFDLSWAILGEVYGNDYKLRYRRIVTTISDKKEIKKYTFVPKQFGFKYNNSLPQLLIAPLYGNKPTYGVRELVQNAVDACRTRMALDEGYRNLADFTHVTVKLNPETAIFSIKDTGIGMNLEEIEKYFLTIGSSYNSSTDWKKTQVEAGKEINKIYRTGRFGIGILAAFLLGPSIMVRTKRFNSEQGYEFTLSLDQDFIQINRIKLPECGTTIEIKCEPKALEQLINEALLQLNNNTAYNSYLWCNWYVDSKPKVEYYFGDRTIKTKTHLFTDFKPVPSNSTCYRDIYWQPNIWSITPYSALYCNGFLITKRTNKTRFSIRDYEKYFPQNLRIPNLKVTDIYNQLPLNLQRDNIDANATFDFEMDLLKAVCKVFLCRLLAIDINSFRDLSDIFLRQSGYTFNYKPSFPVFGKDPNCYPQKCLHGKTLVHVCSRKYHRDDYQTWKPFIDTHPEALFTLNFGFDSQLDKDNFISIIRFIKTELHQYEFSIDIDKMIRHGSSAKAVHEFVDRANLTTHGNYTLISNNQNSNLVEDLLAFISKLPDEKKPSYYLIHTRKGDDLPSPLDDFIKEYAGGDMMIPYDENERKKKFAKIYEECAEEIERYRKPYRELL